MTPTAALAVKAALVVGALGTAAGVTYLVTRDDTPPSTFQMESSPMAWLDAPPDGSVIVLGPVEVTAHAASPDGIASVELVAAGVDPAQDSATFSEVAGGSTFELAMFEWEPTDVGVFDLVVTGIENDGDRTMSTSSRVQIVEAPVPTSSTTIPATTTTTIPATTTTVPATTTVPTTTPPTTAATTSPPTTSEPAPSTTVACTNPSPVAVSPVDGAFTMDRSPELVWSASCDPVTFIIEVSRIPGFERIDVEATVPGSERSWTVPDDQLLTCNTDFHWRIKVGDQTSPIATFTVGCIQLGG